MMTMRPLFGSGYLNLDFRALGIDAKRFIRVLYRYTPTWPYYDRGPWEGSQGQARTDIALDTRPRRPAPPIDQESTRDVIWVPIDTLLVRRMLTIGLYERICQAIDDFAREEDRERREAAGVAPRTH
jgi:hypothetical protein